MTYDIIQEKDADLKNFRIKLIELFILTTSAIFVLMAFLQSRMLLIPGSIILFDILLVLTALLVNANRDKQKIDFGHQTLKSNINMTRLSYQFGITEYVSLGIYALSIIILGYVVAYY